MNQQNTTKKIISCSFKNLSNKKEMDKISITDIMDQTDYRRQTFYDHFDDKYDLITWIFSYDVTDLIQHLMKWQNWEEVLFHLLNYLEENRVYYKKIISTIKLDSFKDYFIYYIKKSIQSLADDYLQTHPISDGNSVLIKTKIDFCAYGLSEMLYHWVLEDCDPTATDYHELLITVIYFKI
ncbi:TetR/AcrR family transcriptional regulator C-terminal domain-containing protein [Carnobacterium sp. TMP28]|uniref:TetR/AcrR family transcriptional regulator C-terminal domain-containing protein n=1 Tax=Carnobacterium sp. TMP28 TaxID=3397060 RepID=UPI0039E00AF6